MSRRTYILVSVADSHLLTQFQMRAFISSQLSLVQSLCERSAAYLGHLSVHVLGGGKLVVY